jgi:cysteinyl-tRNA synthetase
MRLRLGGDILPMVGHVRMYVCGITPYDVTHLGHAATYVWADAAERVLRWHGHSVTVARNVTDVDEVLFAEARRRGESHTMLATLQRASFEGTMATLQVRPPDLAPSAAQHVGHVVQLAQALLDRDAAYERAGTVYARTAHSAPQAGLDRETALRLAAEYHDHPDDPDKDDPLDVIVWQAAGPDDDVSWPSPWGEGRPGWHAECAAMVLALFGPSVDIHCGGGDLAFPHHAAEAALAEAATGVTPFARSWMRAGIVSINGAKMA